MTPPEEPIQREQMDMDVLLVGAGPANLALAIHLKQLAAAHNEKNPDAKLEPEIYIIEKAAEIGHHQMSGAVMDPRGITKLFPDWRERGAPIEAQCGENSSDGFYMLKENDEKPKKLP